MFIVGKKITTRAFAWCLAIDYEIYKKYKKSVKNIPLTNLLKEITHYQICKVIHNEKLFQSAEQHVIPKRFDLLSNKSKTRETKFYRCHA